MDKDTLTDKELLYPSTIVGLLMALIHEVDGYRFDGQVLETINAHYFLHEVIGVMDSTPLFLFLVGFLVTFGALYYTKMR